MRKLSTLTAAFALGAVLALPALATGSGPSTAQARTHWFAGSVSGVTSSGLSVGVLWTGPHDGALNGQTVNVAVNSGTTIVSGPNHTPEQLSSIQDNQLVGVRATETGDDTSTLTATAIHVYCDCHWVAGTLTSVNGTSSVTLQVSKTGPYDTVLDGQSVTIDVNGSTTYIQGKGKTTIGLGSLSTNEAVGIVFSANGFFKAPGFDPQTATFTATQVHAWPHKQVPPPSSDANIAAQTNA